jgi:hypothetical protein
MGSRLLHFFGENPLGEDFALGFSLRRLRSSYTGYCIEVRRSSDNTTLNIGFDSSGYLDIVTLLSFVGSGSGFVKTWYNQSILLQDAIQLTNANQPNIVNSGTLRIEGGKACIFFDGINDSLMVTTATLNTYISMYAICKCTIAKPFLFEHSANANTNSGFFFYGSNNASWLFNRLSSIHYGFGVSNWAGSSRILATLIYNSTLQNYYKNGVLCNNGSIANSFRANTSISTSFNIFSRNSTTLLSEGSIQELIIYNDSTGISRITNEANILNYWGI